jgi:hypothetical protein
MAKKIEEAEVKKECPSCGLGVALDATICEFCGWDFQEEDEWILQIEKLERELMLEKQKFEPGSVEGKIESTLHTPAIDRIEMKKSAAAKAAEERPSPKTALTPPPRRPEPAPEPRISEPRPPPVRPKVQETRPPVREVSPAPQPEPAPAPKVRRVRTVKSGQSQDDDGAQKKTRVVRKVKQ